MTKILIAYASRTGSTREIAQAVAAQLESAGHHVDLQPCSAAPDAEAYEAVMIGSALYFGRWEKPALTYAKASAAALASRPTWLFQSGPCGDDPDGAQIKTPRAVAKLVTRLGLRSPVTFGGRLDRARAVSRLGRWMATGTYAGDFRDWTTIREWTDTVLAELARPAAVADRAATSGFGASS